MEIIIPLGMLVLSIGLGCIFLKEAYLNRKINVYKLFYAGTLILASLLYIFIFDEDVKGNDSAKKVVDLIFIGVYVILCVSYLLIGLKDMINSSLYNKYLTCVEEDRIFVLLDKNDRIKALSYSMAQKLGDIDKKKFIHKKFFELFEQNYTVCELNNSSCNNQEFKNVLKHLKEQTSSAVLKREIKAIDKNGKAVVLNFKDHIICESNKFQGHILIGDLKTADNLLDVEARMLENEKTLDDIKCKFQAHLELTEEAIFFYNLENNSVWANDVFVSELNLNSNTFNRDKFISLLYPDDQEYYKRVIDSLTRDNPTYDTKYRIRTGANYVYIREYGKKLFDSSTSQIMGYIEPINNNHYERSNIEELDNIKSNDELINDVAALYKNGRTFQLVTFRINNIDEINKTHGRQIGNMIMAEYLKAIWKSFVDDRQIYRTGGLEFTFIITDLRKMDILLKALKNNQILKASMSITGNTITTDVYMGIATSDECASAKQLIEGAARSLKTALMDQVRTNYIYYKDIR